ncbi:peptidoglycan DD-metalloendopeptidase family protein [Bacillus sp. ISL-40]|uniref:peptidoglycan DD-metalloendopeptidase family protein n=1 Tax=unclassified Bacillus (in: firmicutes) TaxID=185979 RepID=UPI001BE8A905|nr:MULTISPECIES: M23 family metallopeptidase [unclassified Bacillus (in: firmicutes)]MBT2696845.1 peptidoglycan DD-metalloendopeptidase family protein [Bacillus sp. ISL-40]MBT2742551.1 peptidoglycan DD-metalloendopeptidase family protein [Bacillus sp. ISL-77]
MLLFNKVSKTKKLFLKTTIATTIASSLIAFSNGPVAFADTSKSTKDYDVYLDGTYIGNIADKAVVNKIIAAKVDDSNNIDQQVQNIPYQVFPSAANNQETVRTIKSIFQLQTEASAIIIDGKPVVYVDNQNTAEEVMNKLIQQYVPEDQLTELKARRASVNSTLPALKENESRLLDVRLSKNVSFSVENIVPEKMMSAEEAVTFLQKGTLEEQKYVIKEGDVLEMIAQNHDLTLAEILAVNPGLKGDTLLKIGEKINITVPKPFIEVIIDKEVNKKEEIPFKNTVVEDSSLLKGETKVKQEGNSGSRSVTYKITEQNGVAVQKVESNATVLEQPVNQIVIKGTKVIPSRGEGNFAWPTVGGYVSSKQGPRWGRMHKGIDIARPSNRTIKAADNGVVVSAGWGGGYGNKIVIDHQNGFRTLYGHMSSLKVRAGQTVSKGTSIGVMGATGDATGIHLHFEVYKNGSLVNPLSYLR